MKRSINTINMLYNIRRSSSSTSSKRAIAAFYRLLFLVVYGSQIHALPEFTTILGDNGEPNLASKVTAKENGIELDVFVDRNISLLQSMLQQKPSTDEASIPVAGSLEAEKQLINHKTYAVAYIIVCSALTMIFIKRVLCKPYCNTTRATNNASNNQINERSSLVSNQPKLSHHNKCKYCSHMKPSNPVPITNVMETTPQDAGAYAAHYDLLTWRMYNRIVNSRYKGSGYIPNTICGECGQDITEDVTMNETEEVCEQKKDEEDCIFAFSFEH
jgi:hypothetical protein